MFFVSSTVIASCFFGRRMAGGLIGAGLAVLVAVYAGFRTGVLEPQFSTVHDLSLVTWLAFEHYLSVLLPRGRWTNF